MTKNHAILALPLLLALLGIAFCVWSALGNDVNICVTTGCSLYQDFTIGGISLWWVGTGAFVVLAACALLGQGWLGRRVAGLFVFGDIFLLALLALTAPCISCMLVAILFAFCYLLFRRGETVGRDRQNVPVPPRRSILLWIWLLFFVINAGLVVRSQLDIWPILDESGDARTLMFFSPSCRYCVEGIDVLSGNVNVAFYPVADNDRDVYRLAKMREFLDQGMNLAEALGQSNEIVEPGFFSGLSPDILLLRFRLLRNKAHVFAAGSQGVPFFETRGLPADVRQKAAYRQRKPAQAPMPATERAETARDSEDYIIKDHTLPAELDASGQCGGSVPGPPAGQ